MSAETTRKHEFGSVSTGGYRAAQTVDKQASSVGVADRWTSVVIDSSSIPTEEFPRDFEVLQFQRDDRWGRTSTSCRTPESRVPRRL